jgi:hypothetical protein
MNSVTDNITEQTTGASRESLTEEKSQDAFLPWHAISKNTNLLPEIQSLCRDNAELMYSFFAEGSSPDVLPPENILSSLVTKDTETYNSLAKVFKKGAEKYGLFNYRLGFTALTVMNSRSRHLRKIVEVNDLGGVDDGPKGTGEKHLYLLTSNDLMMLDLITEGKLVNDIKNYSKVPK